MRMDSYSNVAVALALSPAVQAATIKGNTIDRSGFATALLVINTGAIVGAGDYTAKLQESDTTTDGDFTDVVADDLLGTLPASLAADQSYRQGYRSSKRYLRVVVTKNGGTSIAVGAVIIKGTPSLAPVA
ncbi:hypothetical protein G6L07_08075 [Agrobacterium rhizogenes]|nr:hypothetical protein [Rhizobium rhizogenes]